MSMKIVKILSQPAKKLLDRIVGQLSIEDWDELMYNAAMDI